MRFLTMVKSAEKSGAPPLGARVRLSGGKLTVTDGPYAEAKEVISPALKPEVARR